MFSFSDIVTLLPFGYVARTRIESRRDFLYLIASQWGLGILVLYTLSDVVLTTVLFNYALGYIAFISVYEVGYLVNDVWDAKRDPGGRRRFGSDVTLPFLAGFVGVRAVVWGGVTLAFFRGDYVFWISFYLMLVVVFALHNLILSPETRYATFFQLTLSRFALPVMFSLPSSNSLEVFLVSILHYIYFRSLSYLDSKGLLVFKSRREANFTLRHTALLLPTVIVLYFATHSILYPAAWLYTVSIYMVFALWSRK